MGESDLERDPHTVPIKVRQEVIERDNSSCRVCGQYVEHPALHHVEYRSEGGKNTPSNLVVVGWLPGHDCHLTVAHANKKLWQPILMEIAERPSVTALAAYRWKYGAPFRLTGYGRPR